MSSVAIVSGGMDSATLAYKLRDEEEGNLHLLSFDYGQRHKKELLFAQGIAKDLGAEWDLVDLTSVTKLLKGSALTDGSVPVPHGHYEADTMRLTVVPNRNMMMLSIAFAVAVAEGARLVGIGVHAGDRAVYPDCRPEFILALDRAAHIGNEGMEKDVGGAALYAPFVALTKAEIAIIGEDLGVPWEKTWSCYEGGEVHCSKCGTCVERREAFKIAGVVDPTQYADNTYWEQVLAFSKGS